MAGLGGRVRRVARQPFDHARKASLLGRAAGGGGARRAGQPLLRKHFRRSARLAPSSGATAKVKEDSISDTLARFKYFPRAGTNTGCKYLFGCHAACGGTTIICGVRPCNAAPARSQSCRRIDGLAHVSPASHHGGASNPAHPAPDKLRATRLDANLVPAARRRLPLLRSAVWRRPVVCALHGLRPQGTADLLWADRGQG